MSAATSPRPLSVVLAAVAAHRPLALAALGLSFLAVLSEGLSIALVLYFLRAYADHAVVATGVGWLDAFVQGGSGTPEGQFYRICGIVVAATAMRSALLYAGDVAVAALRADIAADLQARLFAALRTYELRFFTRSATSRAVGAVIADARAITILLGEAAVVIVRGGYIAMYAALAFALSWKLAAVALGAFAAVAIGLSRFMVGARAASRANVAATEAYLGAALEYLQGIRTVMLNDGTGAEAARQADRRRAWRDTAFAASCWGLAAGPIMEGAGAIILVGVIALAIATHAVSVAELFTFVFVLMRLAGAARWVNQARANVAHHHGALERLCEVIDPADKPVFVDGRHPFPGLRREIRFEGVRFAYDDGTVALDGIDLVLARGTTTAVVGPSGGGKSTLADLVVRLADPTAGCVRVDGTDLRDLEIAGYRAKVAVVSQDPFLFDDTVRANIAFGRPHADEAAVREAAARANALAFIEELPQGFDTVLGERGVRLSGGQRQRLAIARAILRDPELLVLDEATSALDVHAERAVRDALQALKHDRTVLIIAHRLSTIADADQVAVLDGGRIVEVGGYQALVARRGSLWSLLRAQASGPLPEVDGREGAEAVGEAVGEPEG